MGGPSLEGALVLGEDAETRRCGRGEAAHGMGVMSPTPRASTRPGIAPWLPTSHCVRGLWDTKGWQNTAGDSQSCLWEWMVAPAAAHGHLPASGHDQQRGSCGEAVAVLVLVLALVLVLVLEGLCQVPGVSDLICSLRTPRGGLVLLLHRDVAAGKRRTAFPAPLVTPPPARPGCGRVLCEAWSAAGVSLALWVLEPAQASLL